MNFLLLPWINQRNLRNTECKLANVVDGISRVMSPILKLSAHIDDFSH